MAKIRSHRELEGYQIAFETAMRIFELSCTFPRTEMYALTDQICRSSRSVCSNLAEAWRKRRYVAAFISKLSDAEGEAAETQVWIEFAVRCNYLTTAQGNELYSQYNRVLGIIVTMINNPEVWVIRPGDKGVKEEAEPYDPLF